jgi:hypothetical protein
VLVRRPALGLLHILFLLFAGGHRHPDVPCLRWIHLAHAQVEYHDEQRHEGQPPPELQVGERLGAVEAGLAVAAHGVAAVLLHELASLGHPARDPHHGADDHEPHAVERDARRPDEAHCEAPREADSEQRGGEARGDDELQQPVEVALESGVVGGVEVEHEQLLREDDGDEEQADRAAAPRADAVQVQRGGGVHEERQADDGVLVVVQPVRRDGSVGVEGEEGGVVDEHLQRELDGAAGEDEDELEVADARGGEPHRRHIRVRTQREELDVVEQVPQAHGDEAAAGQDVADAVPRRAAHGSPAGRWLLLQLRVRTGRRSNRPFLCLMFPCGARSTFNSRRLKRLKETR